MKDNNLDISYQNNDIILKSMAQEFKDNFKRQIKKPI